LISVITINLNHAVGLEKTLRSVAMQQGVELEHIIIDGGSSDDSLKMVAKFQHVAKFTTEPDKGIYDAQNKGWQRAKGEYCIFLNSGDRFCDAKTLGHLAFHAAPRTIVYGNKYVEQADGSLVLKEYPDILNDSFFNYDTPPHCCTLIPTRLLRVRGGYDTRLRICADWKFFRQVQAAKLASFVHQPKALSIFEGGGLSAKPENRQEITAERLQVRAEEKALNYRLQRKTDSALARVGLWITRR
jgi:glycosyltransferase involved in cell wall biosynthesis